MVSVSREGGLYVAQSSDPELASQGESAPQALANYAEALALYLELGGAPRDVANLWPEKWNGPAGAHSKDAVENNLRARVCHGLLSLIEAQQRIATNWRTADR